jgi:hypothetical protein
MNPPSKCEGAMNLVINHTTSSIVHKLVCIIKLCSLEDVEGTNNKGAEEEERELYN